MPDDSCRHCRQRYRINLGGDGVRNVWRVSSPSDSWGVSESGSLRMAATLDQGVQEGGKERVRCGLGGGQARMKKREVERKRKRKWGSLRPAQLEPDGNSFKGNEG